MLANVSNSRAKTASAKTAASTKLSSSGKYSVPVVRSTFTILEELSRSELLGLREVTQNTGIPKSTVFRILSTLVDLGYVTREPNRNYRINPRLGRLVSDGAASEALRRLARPLMLELRDTYGETVNLGAQQFDKVTYLEVVPSEFALRLQESRGASVPVHASALGKAILAFSPQREVEAFVRGHKLESVTEHTISDRDAFLAELKRVRNAGVAFDRGEGSMLAVCIGAPILDAGGYAVAAMSISGPASRFNPKKDSPVIASLLKGTTELSRALAQTRARE
ncbi:MAG TPA: IclR family transcriptional regulator [Acidobacteriaceae bacterium]|nr:IclR family transcriptional regulator [Acidobacteriaceae bacterium]